MGTDANICQRGFGERVGMDIPNGAVDEKNCSMVRFTWRINLGLVSMVGYLFN